MAVYKVEILIRKPGEETRHIQAIAGIVGQAMATLDVNRKKLHAGYVTVTVNTTHKAAVSLQDIGLTVKQIAA